MKIRFDFTINFEDSDLLMYVNDFQYNHNFDLFDDISDCPIELIVMALDYFDLFSETYYNQYYDDVNITIID